MNINIDTTPVTFDALIDKYLAMIVAISFTLDSNTSIPTLVLSVKLDFVWEITYVQAKNLWYVQKVSVDANNYPNHDKALISSVIHRIYNMQNQEDDNV